MIVMGQDAYQKGHLVMTSVGNHIHFRVVYSVLPHRLSTLSSVGGPLGCYNLSKYKFNVQWTQLIAPTLAVVHITSLVIISPSITS